MKTTMPKRRGSPREPRPAELGHAAAIGLAPHSGWTALVALADGDPCPQVLLRERVEMAEAGDHHARQPYHAVEGMAVDEAARRLRAYEADAEARAGSALRRIVGGLREGGHPIHAVGLLESAGRRGSNLAAILASHALIHTADGDHFRKALSAAAERCGLAVVRVAARDLDRDASAAIGRASPALRDVVAGLGRQVGPPWGADQKAAALLAWLVLRRGAGATYSGPVDPP